MRQKQKSENACDEKIIQIIVIPFIILKIDLRVKNIVGQSKGDNIC